MAAQTQTTTKRKRPPKARRKAQRTKYTAHIKNLYSWFIKAVMENAVVGEEQDDFEMKTELFFGVHQGRSVVMAKATEPFRIPGQRWASQSLPFNLLSGEGDRWVSKTDGLFLRSDPRSPEQNEIEFNAQVFVLSAAEFSEIKKKVEVIA